MVKLTNGRTTCYVPDEKAQKLAAILGMRIVDETPVEVEEASKPVARRGRPPKKAN